MIKDGFLYLAALIFAAAVLVNLPKIFKGKKAQVFFNFAPPIVLIYLCTNQSRTRYYMRCFS